MEINMGIAGIIGSPRAKRTIGIAGLGLIGGSMAKRLSRDSKNTVLGYDRDDKVIAKALEEQAIKARLTEDFSACDIIIIALYPKETVEFFKQHADNFKKGCLITDVCGIKKYVCDEINPVAQQKDLYFIGGHPMAGKEFSGFTHASADLFNNASMLLTPEDYIPEEKVSELRTFLMQLGFLDIIITSPEHHDRIISYTSQLAHIVSSAYIKSPTSRQHIGFSAGSYKDLTRVAKLNENMWTDLFLLNRENLMEEIDTIIEHLNEYQYCLKCNDAEKLSALLKEGRQIKEALD